VTGKIAGKDAGPLNDGCANRSMRGGCPADIQGTPMVLVNPGLNIWVEDSSASLTLILSSSTLPRGLGIRVGPEGERATPQLTVLEQPWENSRRAGKG
jgi:hypothetical protein